MLGKIMRAASIAIVMALVALTACSKVGVGTDGTQDSALMAAAAEGNWPEVERICTDWKTREPKNAVATWLLLEAYEYQKKMQSDNVRSEWDLLRAESGKLAEVLAYANQLVKSHEESAIAWVLLSDAQEWALMIKESLESNDRAVSLDPGLAIAWLNKGTILGSFFYRRYEEAIKCYDKAIEINPNDRYAWSQRGDLLSSMGRYDEAIESFDRVIEIDPEDRYAQVTKAMALIDAGRYEEALRCYDKVLELNPHDPEVWNYKGFGLEMMGQHGEAIKCYDKAIEIDPNCAEAWYDKGFLLYYELRLYKEAKECLRKAAELGFYDAQKMLNRLKDEGR